MDPTDDPTHELHEEAASFPTAAGQKEHLAYVPNTREFLAENYVYVFANQSSDFLDFTEEVRQITSLDPL